MAEAEINLSVASPCRIFLTGPSGSGKSNLVGKIISERDALFNKPVDKVIYLYREWQTLFDDLKRREKVVFTDDFDQVDDLIKPDTHTLIVFDALQTEFQHEHNEFNCSWFIKKSHHRNCSIICMMHSLFPKNLRLISLNSTHLIMMKQHRDLSSIYCLGRQMFRSYPLVLYKAFKHATRENFSYFVIDLSPECPDKYRLRSSLFPREKNFTIYGIGE